MKKYDKPLEPLPRLKGKPDIAGGFVPKKHLNLTYYGGKLISDLKAVNIYLGPERWDPQDIEQIDQSITQLLQDPVLNEVIGQYMPHTGYTITFSLLDSAKHNFPLDALFTRHDITDILQDCYERYSDVDLANTVFNIMLPPGVVLSSDGMPMTPGDDILISTSGLGGYHGSEVIDGKDLYFTVQVYSEKTADMDNGVAYWEDSWKNIVSILYHELAQVYTNPDMEQSIIRNDDTMMGWYNEESGEIADAPMQLAGPYLGLAMRELVLQTDTVTPCQLLWSNRVSGPESPR